MEDVKARCNSSNSSTNSGQEEMMSDLRRGPWTVEEDFKLINYIASNGEGRWNSLARSAGLKRTGKSCRLRWLNYLRTDVRRGNITLEEQLMILELHSRWGNRWSKIAQHLPGRTDNEIKNYWRTRVQKHAKQLKCDINSKQFKDTMKYRLNERIQAANNTSIAATASVNTSAEMGINGAGANLDYLKGLRETAPKVEREVSEIEVEREVSEIEVEREVSEIEKEAWKLLEGSIVNYCGNPVGTVAASDPADKQPLNYDQVFIRDFAPSALAFLLNGDSEIVKNFLLHTLQLQSWEKTVDCYSPGQGLMPASFKVRTVSLDGAFEEVLDPDFGESAIGRVAPVDSGLWWIILLRAYGKITGDYSLQERIDVQTGIRLVLRLCLSDGFDMFPTLLVTDGSCMIDRRMGIHGHPLEIQALFYSALRSSREMLIVNNETKNLVAAINNRLSALSFHIREYYWVDMKKINEIYRYKTEEYSTDAINKFNMYPEQIPSWLVYWIPEEGGYLMGNLQPAHMDFRFFTLGNLWSIVSSLGTSKQNEGILNLIETKWDDFVGHMPLKICYPALEPEEWRIITGSDPKNTPWSYHNGGSWPTLLWQFTLACIKMGKPELAQKAVDLAEKRLSEDHWPEYYDTRSGRFIGKQSRLFQTWTIAGFLTSKMLLKNPEKASLLFWHEDYDLLETCVCALGKNGRKKCSRYASRSQTRD